MLEETTNGFALTRFGSLEHFEYVKKRYTLNSVYLKKRDGQRYYECYESDPEYFRCNEFLTSTDYWFFNEDELRLEFFDLLREAENSEEYDELKELRTAFEEGKKRIKALKENEVLVMHENLTFSVERKHCLFYYSTDNSCFYAYGLTIL